MNLIKTETGWPVHLGQMKICLFFFPNCIQCCQSWRPKNGCLFWVADSIWQTKYFFLRMQGISSTGCCILQMVGSAGRSMQLCLFGRQVCNCIWELTNSIGKRRTQVHTLTLLFTVLFLHIQCQILFHIGKLDFLSYAYFMHSDCTQSLGCEKKKKILK